MRLVRSPSLLALLALVALLLHRRTALASGGEVTRATLSWVRLPGAEACIAAPALAETVERRLGHPVFSPVSKATLSVEGWVEPAQRPLRWRAIVTVADASGKVLGSREILTAAEDCQDVVAPLALGLALMIDPETPAEGPGAGTPQATVVVPEAEPARPEPETGAQRLPAAPCLPPRGEAWLQAALAPLVGIGAMPGVDLDAVSPGGLLRFVFGAPTQWGAEIQAAYFPPRAIKYATVQRTHLAALFCPLRRAAAVRVDLCAGLAVGFMAASPEFADARYGVREWMWPVADGLVNARVGHRFARTPVVLSLGATLGVPLHRWRFASPAPFELTLPADGSGGTVSGGGLDYVAPPVYGLIDIAVGAEFL